MSASEKYELITTVWYKVSENGQMTSQNVNYNTIPVESDADSIIFSLYTSPNDPLGFAPLGNLFTISYDAVRTPINNNNSAITLSSLKETILVNVPNGTCVATAVYYDKGNSGLTNVKEVIFTVTGGRGIFYDADIVLVTYDDTGNIFGEPFSRRVEFYKLK
jgi:hypothetical protein